ncbi:MAG: hypothetical protein ACOYM0_01115 [Bacteroidales bacterium]
MTENEKQISANLKAVMIMGMSSVMAASFADRRTKLGRAHYEMHQKLLKEYSNTAEAISKLDSQKDISVLLSAIMIAMLKATIQIMTSYQCLQPIKKSSDETIQN